MDTLSSNEVLQNIVSREISLKFGDITIFLILIFTKQAAEISSCEQEPPIAHSY